MTGTTEERRVLAIDPGTTQSAWLLLDNGRIAHPGNKGIAANDVVLANLRHDWATSFDVLVIEKVESFGMAVGKEIFETVFWTGRFAEAVGDTRFRRLGRKAIVTHLCGSARAKDSNVRRELMDRFGGDASVKKGGPLYGVVTHLWAALAVALVYTENPKLADGEAEE